LLTVNGFGPVFFLGHASCVEFVKSFGLPTLVLGGGGYTVRNVARCWTYETSVLLNTPISNDIPYNDFFEYYSPDFKLHLTPSSSMDNVNSRDTLEDITGRVLQNLKCLQGAPSVQMHPVPPDWVLNRVTAQELEDTQPDASTKSELSLTSYGSTRREHEGEYYSSNKDQDRVDGDDTNGLMKVSKRITDVKEVTVSEGVEGSSVTQHGSREATQSVTLDPKDVMVEVEDSGSAPMEEGE
jgi:hypothetical protein